MEQNKTNKNIKRKYYNKNKRTKYSKQSKEQLLFNEKMLSKLLLERLNIIDSTTYSEFKKSEFRNFIKNPTTNGEKLREMSKFLSRVSMPYKRILWYYSTLPLFRWCLSPKIMPNQEIDNDKLFEEYYYLCHKIDNIQLSTEMRNVMYFVLRDGVFFGYIYENEDDFFIHRLPTEYCRIVEIENGVYNFAFNFAYFDKRQHLLEQWDNVFQGMYELYLKDKKVNQWQILDPLKSICIKGDVDLEYNIPFFIGVFEALIDLIDARTLQRNKDVIQSYKLIIQKIPLLNKGDQPDDFGLYSDTILKYYKLLSNNVPDNVGVAVSPMDIDTIDFKEDDRNNDLVANSMKNVFSDSGVSEMLFNSDKSQDRGLDASIKTDVALSWIVVKNIEKWIKRYIGYHIGDYDFDFEILPVHIFNIKAAIDDELELATMGVPNKIRLAATAGISPTTAISNSLFENNILQLHTNWMPLQSSHTMSTKTIDDVGDINKV